MRDPNTLTVSNCSLDIRGFKLFGSSAELTVARGVEGVTEVCHFGHFWLSYGRCAMSGSPMGRSEGST